jgi:uncharacterized protein YqgV (UPF0045/DUF77 family)
MEQTSMIQATVAVYPLQPTGYEAVHRAIEALRQTGIRVEVQAMSTIIAGSDEAVFEALRAAYEAAAASGPTVMTTTISNACPTV